MPVGENDEIKIGNNVGKVFDVSGHTIGHIAVYFEESKLLFSADSLMALGCGRLFEGTAEQMWHSLQKLSTLPDDTNLYAQVMNTLKQIRILHSQLTLIIKI